VTNVACVCVVGGEARLSRTSFSVSAGTQCHTSSLAVHGTRLCCVELCQWILTVTVTVWQLTTVLLLWQWLIISISFCFVTCSLIDGVYTLVNRVSVYLVCVARDDQPSTYR